MMADSRARVIGCADETGGRRAENDVTEDELIQAFIELDPSLVGVEEARVAKDGVPVWALVAHAQATGGGSDQVSKDYDLPIQAVEAALAYYRRHRAAFDARIAANAA